MKTTINNCNDSQALFADMLLDPAAVPAETQASFARHAATCNPCTTTMQELRSTVAAMDDWTAPEPSPYFDTRLHARLREEQAKQPEGLFERMRSFLLFSTGRQFRPAVAGALALVLTVSGGSIALHTIHAANAVSASATVEDLRVLDNNAQALQQMDQLLDDSNDDSDASPTT